MFRKKGPDLLILYNANLQDWAVLAMCSEKFKYVFKRKLFFSLGCFGKEVIQVSSGLV